MYGVEEISILYLDGWLDRMHGSWIDIPKVARLTGRPCWAGRC
jgi:hypothetical protein